MQDNTYFDALAPVLELENAQHGFVERTLGLHDMVVDMIDRGIDWDGGHQIGVTDAFPGVDNLRVSERPAIRQHLYGGRREPVAALLQESHEIFPVRQGLSARERQRLGCRVNERQTLSDFLQYPPVIDIFRR